ncbi:hypothetical protein OKW38_001565 [Paraburkholderia sp. MM5496-R1]|uniref:hypothetical protein n=1 Tax=Paraburkholderia sp. MM5496-R1 TaxID=2991065 RepID=UPI003D2097E6
MRTPLFVLSTGFSVAIALAHIVESQWFEEGVQPLPRPKAGGFPPVFQYTDFQT